MSERIQVTDSQGRTHEFKNAVHTFGSNDEAQVLILTISAEDGWVCRFYNPVSLFTKEKQSP